MIQIHSYIPLEKQKVFHKSKVMFRAYMGGFGSGKTKAGCWESIQLSMEEPGNLGVICRKTYLELKDTTQRTFFEECPPEFIKNFRTTDNIVTFKNGSQILFRSLDQFEKFKSLELGFFYIDEASEIKSEEAFLILAGRLRKKGIKKKTGFLTSNPSNTNHWIYKRFVESQHPDYFLIKSTSIENTHLPEGYVEQLKSLYPPEWVQRYVNGEFGFLSEGKRVYSEFQESYHVKPVKYHKHLPILRGWDFGWRHPAVVFCQVDPCGNLIVLAENMDANILIYDFAQEILSFCKQEFPEADYLDYCDPAGKQRSDKSERTTIQILQSLGIYPQSKSSQIKDGILLIRMLLNTNHDNQHILVNPSCTNLIEGFLGGYHFPKNAYENSEDPMPEKDNYYDHLQDALRYLVTNRMEFYSWLKQPPAHKTENSFNKLRNNILKNGSNNNFGPM